MRVVVGLNHLSYIYDQHKVFISSESKRSIKLSQIFLIFNFIDIVNLKPTLNACIPNHSLQLKIDLYLIFIFYFMIHDTKFVFTIHYVHITLS